MSYVTLHPASISIFINTSDVCARPGTICAALAALGNCGLYIYHSCVDSNLTPSGWLMLIGLFVGLMFLAGVPGWRKWPVAPASAIPNSFLIWIGLAALLDVSIIF